MDKELILKQLVTADGIRTPIEEAEQERRSIVRVITNRRPSYYIGRGEPEPFMNQTREYRLEKVISCTLLVYVERG